MKRRLLATTAALTIGLGALGAGPALAETQSAADTTVVSCRPFANKLHRLRAEYREAMAQVDKLTRMLRRAQAADARPELIRRIHNALQDATARARRLYDAVDDAKAQLRRCLAA